MLKKDNRYTFPKSERLSSKTIIEALFTQGVTIKRYPFVIKYLPLREPQDKVTQVLFSVSKRNFKRAVDRNKIKRLMREAYRLNKAPLAALSKKYAVAYIYTARKILPFSEISAKLKDSILRLEQELS
jgi:ribonuclease P protein component